MVHPPAEVLSPGARIQKGGHEGKPQRNGLQLVAAHKTATRVMLGLILHDTRHHRAPEHVHRIPERRIDRACGMPHVVAPHLPGGIGQPVAEHLRSRQQQQAWRLDGIAGQAHDSSLLALLAPLGITIQDGIDLALPVMLDAGHLRLGTQIEQSRILSRRNFRGQR